MISELSPVAAPDIRARTRILAVVYVYLAELAWALVVATPVHAWARRVWGNHPDGDAVLWLPGGRDLLTWVGGEDAALGIVSRTTIVLLALGVVAMQVPLGALIASLAFSREGFPGSKPRGPRARTALHVGTSAFWSMAGLLVLGSLTGGLVVGIGSLASSAIDHGLADRLGDARSFQLHLLVLGLFVLFACIVGVVVDLARAAVARETGFASMRGSYASGWTMMLRGLRVAFSAMRANFRTAMLAWAWRAIVSLALIGAGFLVAQAIGGKGGSLLLVLSIAHQIVVLARVGLRASWLARATGMVAVIQDAADVPEAPRVQNVAAAPPQPAAPA